MVPKRVLLRVSPGEPEPKKGQFPEKLALFYISCLINNHVAQLSERHSRDLQMFISNGINSFLILTSICNLDYSIP